VPQEDRKPTEIRYPYFMVEAQPAYSGLPSTFAIEAERDPEQGTVAFYVLLDHGVRIELEIQKNALLVSSTSGGLAYGYDRQANALTVEIVEGSNGG
jgi:hypothetical protein